MLIIALISTVGYCSIVFREERPAIAIVLLDWDDGGNVKILLGVLLSQVRSAIQRILLLTSCRQILINVLRGGTFHWHYRSILVLLQIQKLLTESFITAVLRQLGLGLGLILQAEVCAV